MRILFYVYLMIYYLCYIAISAVRWSAVSCAIHSTGKAQIAKYEVVVSLVGGFEDPLSSETSRKTGILQVDIVCYEYFQIPIDTRGEEGGKSPSWVYVCDFHLVP